MVRSTTWRILLALLLASFAASLSSPLGGFLCEVIIPLPTYPLSAIHPEGSIPPSGPEGARGGHVMHGARIGVGCPRDPPSSRTRVWALMPAHPRSPRPIAAVAPVPAGKKGAVHHVVAALGHLLGREQQSPQGSPSRSGQSPPSGS